MWSMRIRCRVDTGSDSFELCWIDKISVSASSMCDVSNCCLLLHRLVRLRKFARTFLLERGLDFALCQDPFSSEIVSVAAPHLCTSLSAAWLLHYKLIAPESSGTACEGRVPKNRSFLFCVFSCRGVTDHQNQNFFWEICQAILLFLPCPLPQRLRVLTIDFFFSPTDQLQDFPASWFFLHCFFE